MTVQELIDRLASLKPSQRQMEVCFRNDEFHVDIEIRDVVEYRNGYAIGFMVTDDRPHIVLK